MIVVDTSAVVAIFLNEPDADQLVAFLNAALAVRISAASVAEILIVMSRRTGVDHRGRLETLLAELQADIEPVTADQAWVAAEAYRRFGKGNHPARLNYGDCFAYALAKTLNMPLLFKGDDFRKTDVTAAVP